MNATARSIPLTTMDNADPSLMAALLESIARVAEKAAFTGGEAVERFEAAFAEWCEADHAVGVSSGTEALALSLRALEIGPGDEVIVPANSFIATAEAVSLVGARPRFADVDLDTQLVTRQTVEAALTGRVRCVIPVHLFGRTVDMDPILELAGRRGLTVIEDTSQAHGARYRGRRVGTMGDAGTFSFYPAKNLGAWGDAGAVVTSRQDLAERVRLLRSHGESPRYHHQTIGTTGRLDAIQAAVLTVKLERMEEVNARRRGAAEGLRLALRGIDWLTLPHPVDQGHDHVYHQFVVRTPRRDELRSLLADNGVASAIHYPIPIHRSNAYAHLGEAEAAPHAALLAGEILSLPIFPTLGSQEALRISQVLTNFSPSPG